MVRAVEVWVTLVVVVGGVFFRRFLFAGRSGVLRGGAWERAAKMVML